MRYRYLYIYVETGGREITVENEDQSLDRNWAWVPKWEPAKGGLSFYFNPVNEREVRLGYIRIPEDHYLFNYGVLDRTQYHYTRDKPFTAKHYTALYKFINKSIAKAGIPTSYEESMKY